MTSKHFASVFCAALLAAGCSSSSSTSAGGQAFSTLNSKISAVAMPPGTLTSRFVQPSRSNATDWTVALMTDPRNSGGTCTYNTNISPQTYMRIDFTESATRCNGSDVNVFGRMRHNLQMPCAMAHLLSYNSSAEMPTSGSETKTLDSGSVATINADCHMDASDVAGATITLTYAVPSDTTNFDRIITLSMTSGGMTESQTMYMRYNDSMIAVAGNESNSNGANRAIVIYDRTNRILKGEYLSGPNPTYRASAGYSGDHIYLHRIYFDEGNDIARVYSSIESTTTAGGAVTSQNNKYVVTGKPNTASSDLAMGLDFWGVSGGSYATSGASYNLSACVSRSSGSLTSTPTVTANAFTCGSLTGIAPAAMTANATVKSYIDSNISNWFNFTAVPTVGFDFNTIHTAGETL